MKKVKVGDVVIAPEGCAEYLTAGKEYVVIEIRNNSYLFLIIDDVGQKLRCIAKECAHLNYKNWIIKQ